ncbi:replication-relaxation family protein [uncultured Litoreibacter sp.]|uniref:replication-relaxation family protein n=1 Tax=uncultured Litoreibacter sp. TaxID=1392394 RepID=UPI002627D930|nr:replication-relaxation family protein [uncultured Litoreibacter sp.]
MRAKSHDSLGRRNRIKAQSTGKRIRLTERDLLWMQKIHEHGPLPSSYLIRYSKHLGTNKSRAQNRLTDLFNEDNNGYGKAVLTRPPQQFQTIDARYNELVYGLSKAGERALRDAGLWSDWVHKPGGPFWHQLMCAKITAGIELETRDRDDVNYIQGGRVLERSQTKLRYPVTFKDPGTGRTVTKDLIPDQIFGIEYVTDDGPRYRFYLVEADRGTEPKTSGQDRKSLARMEAMYEVYIDHSRYKEHLGLKAPMSVLVSNGMQSPEGHWGPRLFNLNASIPTTTDTVHRWNWLIDLLA